jgi:hypothetical protein
VSSIFSVGLKLIGEFTSLEEPTNDSYLGADVVFPADRPEFIGSKRRVEPRDPTQKLRLPIVRSISRSKLAKTEARVSA